MSVSDGVMTQTLNIALLASLKGTLDCVTAFSETDYRPDMAKIAVPTLIVHGSNDQIVPFEATGKLAAAMIDNAQLKIYDGVTHQQQLNDDLLAFCSRYNSQKEKGAEAPFSFKSLIGLSTHCFASRRSEISPPTQDFTTPSCSSSSPPAGRYLLQCRVFHGPQSVI